MMKSIIKSRFIKGLALVASMSCGVSVDAYAQAAVGCFAAPAKMSDGDIASFTGSPASLLSNYPVGGLPMTTQVRGLAGSSATSLDALVGLAAQANPSQKTSIGSGLARAAKSCQATSPDYALLIQQKVAAANDRDLTAAFIAGMSDLQTAALGGANAGGGGAAGIAGGGSTGGSSGGVGGNNSTPTQSGTFSVGSGGSFTRSVTQTSSISPG
ncbi:hypothetical protein J5289_21530 [Rhizobium sp. B230/85]|uniref:hypothetical protein n=1 Tax=unclassified Rhizobium TaxID=2613769 RepID=UPI001ADCEE06|nr:MULTISPECIES: hypothetical protein [unclassified Rhizobium]MBO9136777.1 hypothetical protein [Rhizobium sp. B209b/85]QXZ99079.1 hypothetical protein J5289_21530 [Rhizobium sp. B230/85]